MADQAPDATTIARALIGFARALNMRLKEAPDGNGLSIPELNVLGGIERGYDLSSTLVRQLMLDAPRVSRLVDGLVARGFITREADAEDRRRLRLRLTPSGYDALLEGRENLAAATEDLLSRLTDEERAGIQAAAPGMRRVVAELRGARERIGADIAAG